MLSHEAYYFITNLVIPTEKHIERAATTHCVMPRKRVHFAGSAQTAPFTVAGRSLVSVFRVQLAALT